MRRALLFFFLLCLIIPSGAAEAYDWAEFARLVIPEIGMDAFVVLLEEVPGGWEEVPMGVVGELEGDPNTLWVHREGIGQLLGELVPGDPIQLYRDWSMVSPSLWLRVVGKKRVLISDLDRAIARAGGSTFFLVTCHPPGGPPFPQRLVIEARVVRPSKTGVQPFRRWR